MSRESRRYAPVITFCLVLAQLLWARALYELGN